MARNTAVPSMADAMKAVEELVDELKYHKHGVHVAEVLKAGSLGQHTAVLGNFDVDLVIYSNDLNPFDVLKEGYDKPLHKIRSHMGTCWRISLSRPRRPMSENMRYKIYKLEIEVDILVSPNWDTPEDLYKFLSDAKRFKNATSKQLFRFSVNAAKWQVEFIKKQDPEALELMRRAKAWTYKNWPEGKPMQGRPKSYLMCILVLHAYQAARSKTSRRSIEQLTTDYVKEIVIDHEQQSIFWEEYYNLRDYWSLIPDKPPCILDPANPANNLHETGIVGGASTTSYSYYDVGDGNWGPLVEKIDSIDLTKTVEEIKSGQ